MSSKQNQNKVSKLIGLLVVVAGLYANTAFAATTTPDVINYQGRLLNSSNTPLTGSYNFRFSIWTDADYTAGVDDDGAGTINVLDPGYAGWQETHTVTVGAFGLFDVNLGSITPLPSFNDTTHKYLQVEVKAAASGIASFEVLDPEGTLADATDRKRLANQAYAQNADTIDGAEIGTAAGNIATLNVGDVWDISLIPAGTNADSFVIDNNDDATDPYLQFSTTGANRLSFINASDWFEFSNDVNIIGDLYINGVLASIGSGTPNSTALTFFPVYPNAVVFLDGTSNIGTITTGYDSTVNEHFFNFTSNKPAQQDQDIKFSFQLPADFVSVGDLTFRYQTGSLVDTSNDVEIYIANATDLTLGLPTLCASDTTNVSTTWATGTIAAATIETGCTGATALNAGDIVEMTVKMLDDSGAGDFARAGRITLNYNN